MGPAVTGTRFSVAMSAAGTRGWGRVHHLPYCTGFAGAAGSATTARGQDMGPCRHRSPSLHPPWVPAHPP